MSLAPGLDTPPEGLSDVALNAWKLLRQHGIPAKAIHAVDRDSILYIGSNNRPMTAWLRVNGARMDLATQSGFVAEPSADVLRRLDRSAPLSRSDAQADLYDQEQDQA